jgi:hypothetical protein
MPYTPDQILKFLEWVKKELWVVFSAAKSERKRIREIDRAINSFKEVGDIQSKTYKQGALDSKWQANRRIQQA